MKTNLYTNSDPSELDKFSNLAALWWDEDGKMGMLHRINAVRMRFIAESMDVAGKKALDVGCGGGILTESLVQGGACMTGIDLSAHVLKAASLHAKKSGLNIDYRLESCEEVAKKHPGEFDAVFCMEMLEHVPNPAQTVQACAQLLKPGGSAFFSTINRTPKAFFFAIVGGEYILRLLPKGTHTYKKLIKPKELLSWAKACDLYLKRTSSFIYNPFTGNFSLRDGVDVNYITHYWKAP